MRKIEFIIGENLIDSIIGLHIHKCIDEIAGSYAIEIDDSFATKLNFTDEVKIRLNGHQVINGYIDKIHTRYTKTSQSIVVYGMDKTGDMIKSPHESSEREFKKKSVASIIKKICEPFGITVSILSSASQINSEILETYMASMGIPASQLISELCRDFGVQALSAGDGKLTISGTGIKYASDSLEYGKNILFAESIHSNEDRFKDYYVRGVGISTDNKSMTAYIEPEGKSSDSTMKRHLPYVSFFENIADNAKCLRRSKYERQIRAGLSRMAVYTVGDWDQSDSTIWDINTLVTPNDVKQDFTKQMLINTVDYYLNDDIEEGLIQPYTRLKLVYPETYKESGTIKGMFDA